MVERRHPPRERKGRLVGQVEVTPKPRCSVTAAIAGISSSGSLTGICAALRKAASGLPRRRRRRRGRRRERARRTVPAPAFRPDRSSTGAGYIRWSGRADASTAPRLMPDAVHVEGVEPDLLFHGRNALGRPASPFCYSPGLNAGLRTKLSHSGGVLAKQIVRVAATSGRHRFSVHWPKDRKVRDCKTAKDEDMTRADAIAGARQQLHSGEFLAELSRRVGYRTKSREFLAAAMPCAPISRKVCSRHLRGSIP